MTYIFGGLNCEGGGGNGSEAGGLSRGHGVWLLAGLPSGVTFVGERG